MDTYQPIYDAVRGKISNGDIGQAVESALRECNIGHAVEQISAAYRDAAYEHMRPSSVFRPVLSIDGDMWCALYGANLQDGLAGFGKSPASAMYDFDKAYQANLK